MNLNRRSKRSLALLIIGMTLASLVVLGVLFYQISAGQWSKDGSAVSQVSESAQESQ